MKRNIKKLLAEYEKLEASGKGGFYYSDLKEIADIEQLRPFETLCTGVKFGIALGYRIALRDLKEKKAHGR